MSRPLPERQQYRDHCRRDNNTEAITKTKRNDQDPRRGEPPESLARAPPKRPADVAADPSHVGAISEDERTHSLRGKSQEQALGTPRTTTPNTTLEDAERPTNRIFGASVAIPLDESHKPPPLPAAWNFAPSNDRQGAPQQGPMRLPAGPISRPRLEIETNTILPHTVAMNERAGFAGTMPPDRKERPSCTKSTNALALRF
ncbi:hypothetical protein MKZ38_007823 [Zalerion maritima]|uniref:Uncharacterized protein n=1 Tax=Zalerion maritima TaxID=339359 RepID=A0AAD5RIL0_9PEZI|nr:hypothetical protein MKZ38_007823 [Zalerion maritima]